MIGGLAPQGRLIVLGIAKAPLTVSARQLVGGERGIAGSITGSPYESERTLDFSVLSGVRPMIETMRLEDAFAAYERVKRGDAKFRMVLMMRKPCADVSRRAGRQRNVADRCEALEERLLNSTGRPVFPRLTHTHLPRDRHKAGDIGDFLFAAADA